MAFPTGWSRRVAITIPSSQVGSGGVSNFDVALTAACLPDEMRSPTDPNRAQSDGGDIRFSSDSAGSTRLACDVIAWEYDSSHGADDADILIRVNVPSLSSSADTIIYAWYNSDATESQPAASDTYGQYNAYDSAVEGYWPDGAGNDRTSNARNATANGGLTAGGAAGKLGNGTDYDGSDDRASLSTNVSEVSVDSDWTISLWAKFDSVAGGDVGGNPPRSHLVVNNAGSSNRVFVVLDPTAGVGSEDLQVDSYDGSTVRSAGGSFNDTSGWHHVVAQNVGSSKTLSLEVDNASLSGSSDYVGGAGDQGCSFGADTTGFGEHDGKLDEIRLESSKRSAAWKTTRYNNENAPGTFATVGAISALGTYYAGGSPAVGGAAISANPIGGSSQVGTAAAPPSTYANYYLHTNPTFGAFGLGHTTGLIAS